jgi:hypothetical protein
MNYEYDSMNHQSERSRLLLWAVLGGITGLVIILMVILLSQRQDDPDGDETAVAVESDESDGKKDGEKKTDSGDPIQDQRDLATKAVADAKQAFDNAKAAKHEADIAIEKFDTKLKEEIPYEQWLSNSTNAVTAAGTALTEAKAAKDAADNAKDLKTATTAAAEARIKATEAKKQKDMAETAKTSVIGAIAKAKEKEAEAEEAQANADVTLVPFKGDGKVPVNIVFVEKPDVVSGTNVFAWSTDQNKYDWMKSGKESEPLATRKDGGIETALVTYKIKKWDKPVMIEAGSFSELRFKEGQKLHSEKFELHKKVALEFKEHFNKSKFPPNVPLTRTKSLLIDFISEQEKKEISVYPQHFEIIIGRERTNPAKTEFQSAIETTKEFLNGRAASDKGKEWSEQQNARERIAEVLGKEVNDITWSGDNPVANAITQLKQHLSKEAKKRQIDDLLISISAKSVKDINLIYYHTLRVVALTIEEKALSKLSEADVRARDNAIKNNFRNYANAEIERFKDAGLEKAFAKDIAFDPQDKIKWTAILKKLEEGSKKLEALEKSMFDPKKEAWQLKEGNEILLEITPNL